MTAAPEIRSYFDEATHSVAYLISDPVSRTAAVVDALLDFEAASGTIDTASADRILRDAAEAGLEIRWILETHAHADHLSAADHLKRRTGAPVCIGSGIGQVQQAFGSLLGAEDLQPDGGDFDRLLDDGDELPLGDLSIEVIATPGHTPSCVSYRIGAAVFVGDTLFMPDSGTARTDFPGGDARQLYRSICRILSLPRETRLFMCHDYKAPGRDHFAWETSVGDQLDRNIHVGGTVAEDEYVAMRETRDATLKAPKLLYPAIQVNIRGGRLPPADASGRRYLRIPATSPV